MDVQVRFISPADEYTGIFVHATNIMKCWKLTTILAVIMAILLYVVFTVYKYVILPRVYPCGTSRNTTVCMAD